MALPARVGRYEIELELGHGEMGRVLLARDTGLGRSVAMKVLRDDLGLPRELRDALTERLRLEARAVAALSHPAIVTLHDMGEDDTLGLYLVFERVLGPTLRERLRDGPLPPADVAQLARALGSALTHAHTNGVVHRDVKPENVMLAPTGPKLTDFGISQLGALVGQGRTPEGAMIPGGAVAPAYSAPEALASGAFSAYSDQFSLAATLYEALTGQRPFAGSDALSVAARVATGKQPAPTSLLPGLRAFPHVDAIFDRALAKEPRNRFGSCEAFGSVLASELDGSNAALLHTPAPRSSIVPRATRRWQNGAALLALVVIVLLVAAGRFRSSDGDGVSLKTVASAFARAIASGHPVGAAAAPHHSRSASPPSGGVAPNAPNTSVTTVMPAGAESAESGEGSTAASPLPPSPGNSASIPHADP
jgi:serine/threonine-protein kinase